MKNFLLFLALVVFPASSFALPLTSDEQWLLDNSMGPVASQVRLGNAVSNSKAQVRIMYDTAVNSNGSSTALNGAHSLGVYLPAGAVITNAWYHVLTAFNTSHVGSTGRQAQLALRCETPGNIKAAGVINGLAVDSITAGVPINTIVTFKQITSKCQVVADVTIDNFDTGKLALLLEYYVKQ